MFKVGELFAGIGGIGLGFELAGFKVVWANELDSKACVTYSKNFKHLLINKDMTDVDPSELSKVDILTGGFPCQPFSIAGHRKGFKDDRGNIFFDILRYIKVLSPRVIFLENVKNLAGHDKGRTFKIMQQKLKEVGYITKASVLNTAEYSDIPQNRERIYVVCFKYKKDADSFMFPEKLNKIKNISNFLEDKVSEEYYYNHTKYYKQLKQEVVNKNTVYQWRRVYLRENKNNLCPTLTANMGTGGHNVPLILDTKDIRKLTPRECARFQGFPDTFILPEELPKSALYKQIGNSVTVPIVKAIAYNLFNVLNKK